VDRGAENRLKIGYSYALLHHIPDSAVPVQIQYNKSMDITIEQIEAEQDDFKRMMYSISWRNI
jgi:hypothetical protein